MAVGRYAVVDKDGVVTNVIMWDPDKGLKYTPPGGGKLVSIAKDEPVTIGCVYNGIIFTSPIPLPVDTSMLVSKTIAAIEAEYQQLCNSVYAGPAQRESMRLVALEYIVEVQQAKTLGRASELVAHATAAMRQHLQVVT